MQSGGGYDVAVLALHSRINEVKNHLLVVEAVRLLTPEERGKLLFVVSGTREGDYYQRVVETIREYGLEEQFRFVGWSQTREILGVSDALILPSRNEGFPLSVVEAFLMKLPVIRTRTAGFDDQKYCIPIDMDDPEDLAGLLRRIAAGDWSDLRENVETAYQYAMENFTAEVMTRRTVEVYEKAIQEYHS